MSLTFATKRMSKMALVLALAGSLVACSTSWVTEAINILKIVTPAALNILQLVSVFSGTPINQNASTTITTDVNNVISLLGDYQAASTAAQPQVLAQINAAMANTQADLSTILTTIRVVDPKKQAEITALVDFVISETSAIESIIPSAAVTPAASKAKAPKTLKAFKALMSAKQFKSGYNKLMKGTNPQLVLK